MSELDRPISLKQACEEVFANAISVATLKAEHRRGNLVVFKLGRKHFTTRRDIAAMKEKCRLPIRQQAAKPDTRAGNNLTEEARHRASLAALRLTVETLKSAARDKKKRRVEGDPQRAAVRPQGD
ncbi:hypothetical protein ACVSQB_17360 [Bradyrhizobium elkanii]|uniref:hypothetical protein n=1 Tax=Bradyrhizobium sp. BRP56 TaxID=2793819 RepID=UPI001CD6E864|nr:hypothetical protein [Bradyrhizobium sp. BRP56]MCA1401935.1 hypothetical protein [Bradyrhizobium sp. BRP56]